MLSIKEEKENEDEGIHVDEFPPEECSDERDHVLNQI